MGISRYRKLFLTYIVFTLMTLVIASGAYVLSYSVIADAALESGQKDLDHGRQIIETRLSDVYATMVQLSTNYFLAELSELPYPIPNRAYYDVYRFHRILPSFNITNSFIEDVYVYFFKPQIIISSAQAVVNVPLFYDAFFRHDSMPFAEWDNWIRGGFFSQTLFPKIEIESDTSSGLYVLYCQSFPIDSFSPRGIIMLHIPEEQFVSYIKRIDIGRDGFVAVINKGEQVIAAQGSEMGLAAYLNSDRLYSGKSSVFLFSQSLRYGFRIVAAIPRAVFFEKVNIVRNIFLLILSAELLVGIAIGALFSYRNTKPLRDILRRFGESPIRIASAQMDEYEAIGDSVAAVISNYEELQNRIAAQTPLLRAAFIEQLLSGKYVSTLDAIETAGAVGLSFKHELFGVCLLSVHAVSNKRIANPRLAQQPILQSLVEDVWSARIPFDSCSYVIEPGTTAFVLNFPLAEGPRFERTIKEAVATLEFAAPEKEHLNVTVSGASPRTGLLEIQDAYSEAKFIHDYQLIMSMHGVIFISDLPNRPRRIVFSLEQEVTLSRLVKSGNRDDTAELLDAMVRDLQERHDMTEQSVALFLEQLEGALLRISRELVFHEEEITGAIRDGLIEARSGPGFSTRFGALRTLFLTLSATVDRQKRKKDSLLFNEMIELLSEAYSNPQMGLIAIADAFHLSTGYVSHYFKEHAGIGFAEYIEKLRIAKAEELLAETNLPVGDIAEQIGYMNNNTFYKAFKRAKSISASDFRKRQVFQRDSYGIRLLSLKSRSREDKSKEIVTMEDCQ